jgi:hypothetical protein
VIVPDNDPVPPQSVATVILEGVKFPTSSQVIVTTGHVTTAAPAPVTLTVHVSAYVLPQLSDPE